MIGEKKRNNALGYLWFRKIRRSSWKKKKRNRNKSSSSSVTEMNELQVRVLDENYAIGYNNNNNYFYNEREKKKEDVASKIKISWRARACVRWQDCLHLLHQVKRRMSMLWWLGVCVCFFFSHFLSTFRLFVLLVTN